MPQGNEAAVPEQVDRDGGSIRLQVPAMQNVLMAQRAIGQRFSFGGDGQQQVLGEGVLLLVNLFVHRVVVQHQIHLAAGKQLLQVVDVPLGQPHLHAGYRRLNSLMICGSTSAEKALFEPMERRPVFRPRTSLR